MRKVQLEIGSKELQSTNEALAQHLNSVNRDTSSRNEDLTKLYAELKSMKLEMDQLKSANDQLRSKQQPAEKQQEPSAKVTAATSTVTPALTQNEQLLSPGEVVSRKADAAVITEPQRQSSIERELGRELDSTRRKMEEYERLLTQQQRPIGEQNIQPQHQDGGEEGAAAAGHLQNALKYHRRIKQELEKFSPGAQDTAIAAEIPEMTSLVTNTPSAVDLNRPVNEKSRSSSISKVSRSDGVNEVSPINSKMNRSVQGSQHHSSSGDDGDVFGESFAESERRRLRLEDENTRLMAIVREVTRELKHASSNSSSSLQSKDASMRGSLERF
jgi:hypothetical protein